jgi:hypothetical protein|tara:strand:- start:909 stop:1307 length:399 start_codon:yes stop_codon:yes gene_type:complete
MSRQIKTARGRMIDMGAITAKNETVKAVGNILMNARGDRLNQDGSVRMTVEQMARIDQDRKAPPVRTAISDPKPVMPAPVVQQRVDVPDVDLDPDPISKITRTRDDGTKYVEIEYDDGSVETLEITEDGSKK